jgi:hypothetical protein
VIPEVVVVDQRVERFEQRWCLFGVPLLLECVFQLSDQVLEADRVLLAFRKAAMSRLVQGKAGPVPVFQQLGKGFTIEQSVHAWPPVAVVRSLAERSMAHSMAIEGQVNGG